MLDNSSDHWTVLFDSVMSSLWWTNIFPSILSTLSWWTSPLDSFFWCWTNKTTTMPSNVIYMYIATIYHDFISQTRQKSNLFRRNFTCAIWAGTLNLNLVGYKKRQEQKFEFIHLWQRIILKKKQRPSVVDYTRGCWSINQRSETSVRVCVGRSSMQNCTKMVGPSFSPSARRLICSLQKNY